MVDTIVDTKDKVCVIGEEINLKGKIVRLGFNAFMESDDSFNVVVLHNVKLPYEKFVDLVYEASKKSEVLVCDFTLDRKRYNINEPIVKDTTIEYYNDLGKLSAVLYQYPFVYVYGGFLDPVLLAVYFRRMLPTLTLV